MSMCRTLKLLVAVLAATFALAVSAPAGAVGNPDYTAPPPSEPVSSPPPPARQVTRAAAPGPQRLPITGSDTVGFAVIGAALVAGGAGVLVVRRRLA